MPQIIGRFEQQVHNAYSEAEGLPSADVLQIVRDSEGAMLAKTSAGCARFDDRRWLPADVASAAKMKTAYFPAESPWYGSLADHVGRREMIRAVANHGDEIAVAAENGLFIGDGKNWNLALPQDGPRRWAPVDVRAVAYDSQGQLWFASPQGVGFRIQSGQWKLFAGAEGLPFNDFTCMAAGPKGIWFGTTNGAIRYFEGEWEFRQGRRWLVDNHVRDIAIGDDGSAWFATPGGVSRIEFRPVTLREKATFYEEEIDEHHRRTRLGFVNPAKMTEPGAKLTATPYATDNDGHFMGLYLGAASLGYAATKSPKLRADAVQAFETLAFLSKVTEGGTHPAPPGFIARAIVPSNGPNPNDNDNAEQDRQRRANRDGLWKVIQPRWPMDESGDWYWKCDSSSDELDGYYFGFGIYYDHVCATEHEKARVRDVVRQMTDHLLDHNYSMIDHDGKPTRWGHFSPEDLNRNEAWWVERGLNSLSILTYLSVAHHITGDPKYREAQRLLAIDHGYAMNGMTQPVVESGPGSFGQADDNMAFMNYYHLIRYEADPKLLSMFYHAIYHHWQIEKYERNPFFNFVYAACCLGKTRKDHWSALDLSPPKWWLEESVDTLKRYPLDLVDWPMSNAHRIDMLPLPDHVRDPGGRNAGKGFRNDGKVFRIDEQHAIYWGDDPWELANKTDGSRLREGVPYLLAYYLGLVHEFIVE